MNPVTRRLLHNHTKVNELQATLLREPETNLKPVRINLNRAGDPPPVPENLVRGIMEIQTKWLKLRNASPTIGFEIRRPQPGETHIQLVAPTNRLERKIRTHITETEPETRLETGNTGLPIYEDDTVGGALLTTGRRDWYPLRTDYDKPPNNAVVSALHRHAMQRTRFIAQVLFQPVAGQPLRRWWWKRLTYKRIGYLRKEKEKLWGSRKPTPREKQQATEVERKAGTAKFHTSIRLTVINGNQYTPSRIKELGGAYNRFENPDTGQYLNIETVRSLRQKRILQFASAVAHHNLSDWSLSFRTSPRELAALTSIPHNQQ
jgi:hypothetical protein